MVEKISCNLRLVMKVKQMSFDKHVLGKLRAVIYGDELANAGRESSAKVSKVSNVIFDNLNHDLLAEIFELVKKAQEENLEIPDEVACLMIGYVAGQKHAKKKYNLLTRSQDQQPPKDAISQSLKCRFELNLLIDGHREGRLDKLAGVKPRVIGDINNYFFGKKLESIKAKEFGYLLGLKKDKLSVSSSVTYLSEVLLLSESTINKMNEGYGISKMIDEYNASFIK